MSEAELRMFELFFMDMQQNIKLFLIAPILCAVFRAIFIAVYNPHTNLNGQWRRIFHCFRYGFWWGMDFNAYVFLIPLILISLPGAFFPQWLVWGDVLRVIGMLIYTAILYAAFMGKMIFYKEYHDTYNDTVWLGKNAEKHNLVDIFLHQYHGYWILLGYIPYTYMCKSFIQSILALPSVSYPLFTSVFYQYLFNALVFIGDIAAFYFFRYGGTFNHDNKPEWDTVPSCVKEDIFFARATVDDLVALEHVWQHPIADILVHSDDEAIRSINVLLPEKQHWVGTGSPVEFFKKKATGARIHKPKHIFLVVGESYAQNMFDDIYADLHLVDRGKQFRANPHTFVLNNFLPAGDRSRPSIVSLMAGIYDARLELNEREAFWRGTLPTALPLQLKKLGYDSVYWYGGNPTYGNFNQYGPAVGFDKIMAATEFCGADAPKTWVGVYDHIFLEKAAALIKTMPQDKCTFHYLYTTSAHGPYKMPLKELGYDKEKVMPTAPAIWKQDTEGQKSMGTCWYADQALSHFVEDMLRTYPDSLMIVTGDHGSLPIPLGKSSPLKRRDYTLREIFCTSFSIYHRDLQPGFFQGNTIGGHMNILPTILELIAPQDFTYYALDRSLLEPIDHVVTPYHWLTRKNIGVYRFGQYQSLQVTENELPSYADSHSFQAEADAVCDLTGWIARHAANELRVKTGWL